MKAKFIGRDGSLGLKHDRIYDIELYPSRSLHLNVRIKTGLFSDIFCPYETLMGFYKNWEIMP